MNAIKSFIKETIKSILLEQKAELDEIKPPSITDAMEEKILAQYPGEPGIAYATMWKIHNESSGKKGGKRKTRKKRKSSK